jgi:CSLREA domain-containing protein
MSRFVAWLSLVGAFLFYLPSAHAATITFNVDSNADEVDASPNGTCAAADGKCTLRAAIQEADAQFMSGNAFVINLQALTYKLTIPGTDDNAANGDLDILGNISIIGMGADKTVIDGGGIDRVFDAMDTSASGITTQLSLTGLTVTHGNISTDTGGGINLRGNLSGNGGTTLTVDSCNISNNTAFGGGGINGNWFNPITIRNTLISNNQATSAQGGGICTTNGTATISNSTISGNTAADSGGGIFQFGGAGTFTLNNVTLTHNTSDSNGAGNGKGGGIYSDLSISLSNSIVAGNTDNSGAGPDCTGAATFNLTGYSLVQTTTGCTLGGDLSLSIQGKDPLLGPLQNNGGPTQTHALLDGSPAIDTGNPATPGTGGITCEAKDQRGVTRPQFKACDMGAFEKDTPSGSGGGSSGGCELVKKDDSHLPAQRWIGFFTPWVILMILIGMRRRGNRHVKSY